jgi:D-glycero-D-manno-heptose 1,7-bisphosphate phosphatase
MRSTMQIKKALVLDFDGTIRRSKSGKTFIEGPHDIELIPSMDKWVWRYREMGYLIFGLSNQGGVAHGFKTFEQVQAEFEATYNLFNGNPFHAVKWCMHDGKGRVEPFCHRSLGRKPDIGLLFEMECDAYRAGFIVDWDHSLFVGDRPEDEECAKRAAIPFRHIDHFLTQPHEFPIEEPLTGEDWVEDFDLKMQGKRPFN